MRLLKFGWPAVVAVLSLAAYEDLFRYDASGDRTFASDGVTDPNPSLGTGRIALDVIGSDAIPEPRTFLLVGAALVGLGLLKQRSNKP